MKKFLSEIYETNELRQDSPKYYLLQLINGVRRADLKTSGIEIVRILGESTVIARGSQEALERNRHRFSHKRFVNSKWKISRSLLHAADRFRQRNLVVKTADVPMLVSVIQSLSDSGIVFVKGDYVSITATVDQVIDHIIDLKGVSYVGEESLSPHLESRVIDLYLSPNRVNTVHTRFSTLNGSGRTLSIKERAYNPEDVDLQGRHIPSALASVETDNHATDIATIAAGAGNSFINGKGVAYAARITSSDFANLFSDDAANFLNLDAWVQNHSYGTVVESVYGALAASYDDITMQLPQLLHVFSSGNSGAITPEDGKYAGISGMSNLTGNFKMAKNVLTVGCVDTIGRTVAFSSRGPAYDGRVKPELVAYSTQGSSNAAALVSGVAVLLQEMYADIHDDLPPAALIKSMLINSALDAGPPGIDYLTGYGNVDAYRAIQTLQSGNFLTGSIGHGGTSNFFLDIPAGVRNLKVTLVWADVPAEPGSARALVNDLDFRMENGTTWLPWVLNTDPDIELLSQPAQRGPDHLNNIEQITIENPAAGNYQLLVNGFDVPEGAVPFYITYQWDTEGEFTWTFPTSGDNAPYDGESGTYFFWRSTMGDNTGRLEYTMDDGATWNIIADAVDLTKEYFRWNHVPEINISARARMVVENSEFLTDGFTISRPVFPTIGFNCTDSVMINWPRVTGANTYTLYALTDDPFVQPFTVATDTFAILGKTGLASAHFAIGPEGAEGTRFLRGPLFDYNALGSGCFFRSFISHVVPQDGIYLDLELGTTYSVSRVDFERKTMDNFHLMASIQPQSNHVEFLDNNPRQGKNQYRVIIHFQNGEQLVSDVIEDYYLTSLPFVVFPNPVTGGSELTVFSKVFENQSAVLRIYRADGSLALLAPLASDRESIFLHNMSAGFYLFTITSEDGVFNGRIVVK